MHISWARLASFCHLGFISDPLIVSKFHNETQDPKGQENKIYTIVKGRETGQEAFYPQELARTPFRVLAIILVTLNMLNSLCTRLPQFYSIVLHDPSL